MGKINPTHAHLVLGDSTYKLILVYMKTRGIVSTPSQATMLYGDTLESINTRNIQPYRKMADVYMKI